MILLDDFGLAALTEEQRRDLLEILEDRYERRSTVVTSQYPVEHWHDLIGDPTLADAIARPSTSSHVSRDREEKLCLPHRSKANPNLGFGPYSRMIFGCLTPAGSHNYLILTIGHVATSEELRLRGELDSVRIRDTAFSPVPTLLLRRSEAFRAAN